MNTLGTRTGRGGRTARPIALVTSCLLGTVAVAALVRPQLGSLADAGRLSFAELLAAVAAVSLVLACAWFDVVAAAVSVEAITRGRARAAHLTGCPAAWRHWLLGLCGAALLAGVAAPTYAAEQGGGAGPDGLDGLPLPDRPVGAMPVHRHPHRHHHQQPGQVVVRAGDSLWRIAERSLPPDASWAQVDRLWRRIDARNARVIGADPDLIRPGQRLELPEVSDSEESS